MMVEDEKALCDNLRALVEEWGSQNIIITIPEIWRQYVYNDLVGDVSVTYSDQPIIRFNVVVDGEFMCSYQQALV